jgi:hypothetical protein
VAATAILGIGYERDRRLRECAPISIASLYRQTAAFRPIQSCSLLSQAEEWEHLAVAELEGYFAARSPFQIIN